MEPEVSSSDVKRMQSNHISSILLNRLWCSSFSISSLRTMSETKMLNEIVQSKAPVGINSPIGAAVVAPSINHGALSGLTLHLESKFHYTINCMMTIKASSLSTSRIGGVGGGGGCNYNGVYLQPPFKPLKVTWQT